MGRVQTALLCFVTIIVIAVGTWYSQKSKAPISEGKPVDAFPTLRSPDATYSKASEWPVLEPATSSPEPVLSITPTLPPSSLSDLPEQNIVRSSPVLSSSVPVSTPHTQANTPHEIARGSSFCDPLQSVIISLRDDARNVNREKSYAIVKDSLGKYRMHPLWEGTGNSTSGSSNDLKPYFTGDASQVILAHSHPPIQSRVAPPSVDDIIMIMMIDRAYASYGKLFHGIVADAEIVWEVSAPIGTRFSIEIDQLGAVLLDLFQFTPVSARFDSLWPTYGRMTAAEHIFSEVRAGAFGTDAAAVLKSHDATIAKTFVSDIMPLMDQLVGKDLSEQNAAAQNIVNLWSAHGVTMRIIPIDQGCTPE